MDDIRFYISIFSMTFIFVSMLYMAYDSDTVREEYPSFLNFLLNLPKFLSGK